MGRNKIKTMITNVAHLFSIEYEQQKNENLKEKPPKQKQLFEFMLK